MKLIFNDPYNKNIFNKYISPLLIKKGFSWDLFPNITISDTTDLKEGEMHWNRPHITFRSDGSIYIYIYFMPKTLLQAVGLEEYRAYDPDTLNPFHEYGHAIVRHIPEFKKSLETKVSTPLWKEISKLTNGEIKLDFGKSTVFTDYDNIIADESFAEYFDDCICGKIDNEPFLQRLRELLGIKYIKLTIDDKEYEVNGKLKSCDVPPMIIKNRTMIPVRLTHTEMGDEVHYLEDTKEVVIIRK